MINSKRAKAIRKAVRSVLSHLPLVAYTVTAGITRLWPDFTRGLRTDGTPHTRPVITSGRNTVSVGTQRYAYLQTKKFLLAR